MLKARGALRSRGLLVEKLGGLQGSQRLGQRLLRLAHDLCEQAPGHDTADDREGLQQHFLGGRQAVEARCQYLLHGGRELDCR
jgi:hypothetical protein